MYCVKEDGCDCGLYNRRRFVTMYCVKEDGCDYGLYNRRRFVTTYCVKEDGCDCGLYNRRRFVAIYVNSVLTPFSHTYTGGSFVRKLCRLNDEYIINRML